MNCLDRDVAGLSGLWISAGEHQAPPDRIEPTGKSLREVQPADGTFNLSRSGCHRDTEGPLGGAHDHKSNLGPARCGVFDFRESSFVRLAGPPDASRTCRGHR